MRIFHIVRTADWDSHAGSMYEAESLAAEGFIHCSFAEQLEAVIRRYYSDADEIVVLEIDPTLLTSKLVVEPSTGGENYPHIYGPINKDAIVGTERRKLS
jgi:uncharacterized protein (DUF952 family)